MTLEVTAEAIYVEHYGHLDDKFFREVKIAEIEDWLSEGGVDEIPDKHGLRVLKALWAEYDEDEIARQNGEAV